MAEIHLICPTEGCKGMVDQVQVKFVGNNCQVMLTHHIPGGGDHINTYSWPVLKEVEPEKA